MTLQTYLTIVNVVLVIGVVAIGVAWGLLIRSEFKLRKYGESWIFKKKKK